MEDVETLFEKGARLSGRVRVDLPSRFARLRIIPRLESFLDEHPGIHLELGVGDRLVDLVREGYDCVVRVGALADSSLTARRVGEMPVITCASPAYLARHGTPRQLRDLSRHWLIHYAPTLGGPADGFEYEEAGERRELPMKGRLTVNNAEAYVAACQAGLGLIQTPRTSLEDDLRHGRLVEVLSRHRARPLPVHVLIPHRRQLSRRVRGFIDWLEARLAEG